MVREPKPGVRTPVIQEWQPVPPPLPSPAPSPGPAPAPPRAAIVVPSWTIVALAVAGVVVTQAIATLHAFPASQSITVALIVLGGVLSAISGVQEVLAAYTAHSLALIQAHAAAMRSMRGDGS